MTEWTEAEIIRYAALHKLDIPSPAFAGRLRTMAQKAADAGAAIPRRFDREDQPAPVFRLL